jgi:pSer/pThr/pTyr-binding forkhead associated (FHA) protein
VGLVTAVPGFSRPFESPLEAPSVELEEEDLEATRLSAANGNLNWAIELPGGEKVEIGDAIVVGRNPVPPASLPSAVEVRLNDHTQSVSKTHATLHVRDGLLWVTDLHSTNGTALTNLAGEVNPSPAGTAVPASDGWQIGFGDFVVRLRGR